MMTITKPLTPASTKIAHVYKLHQGCTINQQFRDLDFVLIKDWEDLHPRTKHHYALFLKPGIRPVLESIARPSRTVVGLSSTTNY